MKSIHLLKGIFTLFRFLFSSLFIILTSTFANSQVNQEWLQRYNGGSNSIDYANAIKIDELNNIYVSGSSYESETGFDIVTIKYNSSGAVQWIQKYNGQMNDTDDVFSIELDRMGNVYITGFTKLNESGSDIVTIKYNSSGSLQWVRTYNGTGNANDQGNSVAVDNLSNIYVTGRSTGTESNYDYISIKYDPNGVQQWVRRYNGSINGRDEAITIAIDNMYNTYVTGQSEELGSSFDCTTIKYNSAGDEAWVRKHNGTANNNDKGYFVNIDKNGNIYIAGTTLRTETFVDYLLIKYDTAGTQQWAEFYDGYEQVDIISSMIIDRDNNIFVTGLSYTSGLNTEIRVRTLKYNPLGTIQWSKEYRGGTTTLALSMATDDNENLYVAGSSLSPGTGFDYLILKYDPIGILQWEQKYNGFSYQDDYAKSIVLDIYGNIYVTGESFGNGTDLDYVTIKYSNPTGVNVIQSVDPTDYYLRQNFPNPFNPKTIINYELRFTNFVSLRVFDALGNEVAALVNQKQNSGSYNVEFDGDNYPSGVYLYRLEIDGNVVDTKRMILLK